MAFNQGGQGQKQAIIVNGTAGNDILWDTEAWEFLIGGNGNDVFMAGSTPGYFPDRADQFNGGSGTDTANFIQSATMAVDVDLTDQVAWRKAGALFTGPIGLISIENVVGTVFNDQIRGDGQANTLYGHDGDDWLHGEAGNDTLYGGTGNDTILGGSGVDVLHGENGNDDLDGGDGNDTLYGGNGNDVLKGGEGNDFLWGEAGNDTLIGGGGIDKALYITNGNVQVNLGFGIASGALGSDTLSGIENVDSGSGHDVLVGSSAANRLDAGAGNDTVSGGSGNDVLLGGDGNDTVNGGNDNDTIEGGSGNDTLNGDGGHDLIKGGSGNDVIRGGSGNDVIHADGGADTIRWNAGDLGLDTVHGFTLGTDKVAFGNGFLVAGDPADNLLVFDSGAADSLLVANIQGHGYEAIATFKGITGDALEAAIENGVLFGYQAGFQGVGDIFG